MTEESMTVVSPEEISQIQEEVKKAANELVISESGEIEFTTATSLIKSVAAYRKLGLVPKQFDTDAKAAGAILFCRQLGLQPLVSWGEVAFIKNKYAPFGTLFRAIAMRSPLFGEDDHFFLDDDGKKISVENGNIKSLTKPWAAVCRTKVKGGEVWKDYIFTREMAEEAGLIRPGSAWVSYMSDLMMHKAVARAYRGNYADSLHGCTSAEDLDDSWEKDVSPKKSLNDL